MIKLGMSLLTFVSQMFKIRLNFTVLAPFWAVAGFMETLARMCSVKSDTQALFNNETWGH
jgi:hypothetical protein